ncbi:MAG: dephospho-CoA kinase [Pseudomonadota bacterium]
MSFRLGLTGSIGMGKSTTAGFFEAEGVPVWDADAAVHRLYRRGGAAFDPIIALCPPAEGADSINREALSDWIASGDGRLKQLEQVVHPLVSEDRHAFARESKAPILLFDVPLLFETGLAATMDAVVVVTTPRDVQRTRVLARPGMTEDKLASILARQMPDAEKRSRADYVIETLTLDAARKQVQDVVRDIRGRLHARGRAGHGNDGV